jgi:hypothetical protein
MGNTALKRLKGSIPADPKHDGDTTVQSSDLREVIAQAMRDADTQNRNDESGAGADER